MNKNPFLAILSLSLMGVLIVSAVLATPVFADGGTMPPTPPSPGGSTRSSRPSSNNLSNVPSGTKIVIVDDQGDKLALGSQLAQDILNSGDPVWCPSTVAAPTPGSGGCTPSGITTLWDLINDINFAHTVAEPAANGTIWISGTSDSSASAITIDGSVLTTWAGFTLTLQGGWSGISGNKTISGQTTFTAPISIVNWNNNVTVNNIVVQTTGGDGLTVTTSKNIVLNTVESDGNGSDGANLDNTSGTAGTVTVNNSEFDLNWGVGLNVLSHGAITVSNLVADNGYGRAAILDNCVEAVPATPPCTSSAQPVTVSGTNEIDGNSLYGMEIDSTGAITVNGISASGNGNGYGLFLDNHLATTAQNVTLTGTNVFNNDFAGLAIYSVGAIAANNITANSSTNGNGAYLDNCNYNTSVCTTPAAQTVTLTGINVFNGNAGGGLYIYSMGQITASGSGLTADGNGGPGAFLRNDYPPAAAGVTVSGTGEFNGNGVGFGDAGLSINSSGAVLLNTSTLHANGNGGAGLFLNNAVSASGVVTLTGVNQFAGNYLDGLEVLSSGNITASNLTAIGNGVGYDGGTYDYQLSGGVFLDNIPSTGPSSPTVMVSGNNTFTGNYESGLVVKSYGNITTSNLNATGNGLKGSVISWTWSGAALSTGGSALALPKLVSVNGVNLFNNNFDDGLYIQTPSAITTNNLTAIGNANGFGVYLDNCFYTGSSCQGTIAEAVTVNGSNTFGNNGLDGLDVYSYGNIKAANLTSSGNSGNGMWLQNNLINGAVIPLASKGTVTLTGTATFNANSAAGMDVYSNGAIKGGSIHVLNNGSGGAQLDNSNAATAQVIALSGSNSFSYNGADGLDVTSKGAISLSSLSANSNGGTGANLFNAYSGLKSAVTLSGSNTFSRNGSSGLQVDSNGAITLSNPAVDGNTGGDGAVLDNCNEAVLGTPPCTTPAQNVTLTGIGVFTNNANTGLQIYSSGAISINTSTLTVATNGSGVALDNSGASTAKAVSLKGSSLLDRNDGTQLSVLSRGAITAANLTALESSFGSGVSLINDTHDVPGAVGGVTLSGTSVFNDNSGDGLSIQSSGAVSVNNITANGNGQLGIGLDNCNDMGSGCTTSAAPVISLTGTISANNNGTTGLFNGITVVGKGVIKAVAVTATGNTLNGASFDNHQGSSTASVTLSGTDLFNSNGGGGLIVSSNGAVSLSGANFFNNNTGGVGLLITANGAVTLTKITADLNSGDGLNVTSPLTLGVTCGNFLSNGGYGVNLATTGKATLTGVALFGNTPDDTINQTGAGLVVNQAANCVMP